MSDAPTVASTVSTVSIAWAVFSAIGGSIVGAVISTAVSFTIQKRNLDAAKAQRDEDRLNVRRAQAYSLLFKMIKLASSVYNMKMGLQSCFAVAKERGNDGWEPWQIAQPIVPPADPVHFSSEEMALVLSLNDKVFNEIAALDNMHNHLAALFDLYGEMRQNVLGRFSGKVTGSNVSALLTPEESAWLAPRALELNGLITELQSRAEEYDKEAWDGLIKLRGLFESSLGIKHKIERKQAA